MRQPQTPKERPKSSTQEAFEQAVRRRFSPTPPVESTHEIVSTWIKYALETNLRGSQLALHLHDQLQMDHGAPRSDWGGRRVLDAGCAYGGTLRAFLDLGADVLGVDIDKELLDMASLNLADEDPDRFELMHVGIEDLTPSEVGKFDLIICDNVLEHVHDPAASVTRLANLLAPGGALYLAVPNPFAPAQVKSDPHFGIFGITLLEREDAERYYRECGWKGDYTVGHFASAEDYLSWMAGAGLSSWYDTAMDFPPGSFSARRSNIADLEGQVSSLADGFAALRSNPSFSSAIHQALQTGFRSYHNAFARDRAYVESSSDKRVVEEFLEWYFPLVWHFLAHQAPVVEPITRPSTIRSSRS